MLIKIYSLRPYFVSCWTIYILQNDTRTLQCLALCYLSFYFLLYTLFFFSVITFRLVLYSYFLITFHLRYYSSYFPCFHFCPCLPLFYIRYLYIVLLPSTFIRSVSTFITSLLSSDYTHNNLLLCSQLHINFFYNFISFPNPFSISRLLLYT